MAEQVNTLGYLVQLFTAEEFREELQKICEDERLRTLLFLSIPILRESMTSEQYVEKVKEFQYILPGEENAMRMHNVEKFREKRMLMDEGYLDLILEYIEKENYTLYFVGDQLEKLSFLLFYCKEQYPGISVVGTFVGGEKMDDESLLNDINVTCPDIIMTTIEPQLQENWIANNYHKFNGLLCIGADVLVRRKMNQYSKMEDGQDRGTLFSQWMRTKTRVIETIKGKIFCKEYENYMKQKI